MKKDAYVSMPVNKPCTYYIYRVFKAIGYSQNQSNDITHNYVKDFYEFVKTLVLP